MSALRASLVIWIVWSAWHFPAFALDSNREGEMPLLMFTIFVLTVSVVLTWMFNGTRGSLLIPVLFHGSANASEQLYELLVPASERSAALWWLVALYGAIGVGIIMIHGHNNLSAAERVVWRTDASDR